MNTPEIIAIASAALSAVVGVSVPVLTFRFALRQQQIGWLRTERAKLYADMLAEAYAEKEQLEYEVMPPESRKRFRAAHPDLRLPPDQRAQLGARANSLASRRVGFLYNTLERHAFEAFVSGGPWEEAERLLLRARLTGALDDLQEAIRHELGTDTRTRTERWRSAVHRRFRRSR